MESKFQLYTRVTITEDVLFSPIPFSELSLLSGLGRPTSWIDLRPIELAYESFLLTAAPDGRSESRIGFETGRGRTKTWSVAT